MENAISVPSYVSYITPILSQFLHLNVHKMNVYHVTNVMKKVVIGYMEVNIV